VAQIYSVRKVSCFQTLLIGSRLAYEHSYEEKAAETAEAQISYGRRWSGRFEYILRTMEQNKKWDVDQ
jgi:hypothetical protein